LFIRYSRDEIRLLRRFIRGYILGILKPVKPEHITDYARKNKVPNISSFIKTLPDFVLVKLRKILTDKPEIIDEWIQPAYIIRKIGEERPDLYECIKDPKKYEWLKKFINYARSILRKI